MSTVTLAKSLGRFVTTRAAMQRLDLTSDQINKLIRSGALTVRKLPGLRAQVLADDIDRLERESLHPRTTSI